MNIQLMTMLDSSLIHMRLIETGPATFFIPYDANVFCPENFICLLCLLCVYEGCSNMNASSFITFFTYMLRQNGKRFYKGLYVTFKLAPDLKKNTIYLSSYSPLNKGNVSILTNSML